MKILQINDYSVELGGAETHFKWLCELLKEKENKVACFYPAERYQVLGKKGMLGELKDTLQNFHPRIVHVHSLDHKYLPILDLIDSLGFPMIHTVHDHKIICLNGSMFARGGICDQCRGGKFYQAAFKGCVNFPLAFSTYFNRTWLKRNPYNLIRLFISPSQYLKETLKEWGFEGKVAQLYNFLPSTQYQPTDPAKQNTLIFAGRLSPMKGLDTLLSAVKELPFKLLILGEGEMKSGIKRRIESGELKNVKFLGHLSGKAYRDTLSKAGVVVVPSPCPENSPLVIAEAFALGIPVIGSSLGGIPELQAGGERGLTFQPGNENELKQKILFLMENPGAREKLGKAAREFALEHFNPDSYYSRIMEFYNDAGGSDQP